MPLVPFTLDAHTDAKNETIWLTQDEIALLFDTARSTITYHINNIFTSLELDKNTSVEKFDGRVDHKLAKLCGYLKKRWRFYLEY